jgi:transposase
VERNDQKSRSKYGRRFDEEFRRDAVRMLESRLRTAEQLAGELGVSVWSLKRWAKLYAQDSAAGGPPVADAATLLLENARLRRELETVSRQRDILKKALGILGQEPPNATK